MERRHGLSHTRAYNSYHNMLNRCNGKGRHRRWYKDIVICSRWLSSFSNFYSDMGECPEGMTLERRNTLGNYDPSNCKWLPKKEQGKNTRQNRIWCVYGTEYTSLERASIALGVSKVTIRRWCSGAMNNGRYYKRKGGCYSKLLY